MTNSPLEVADILRRHGDDFLNAYGGSLSGAQKRVLRAITTCRTAALGGHVEECDECGHRQIAYNSCRNRHCPKCQAKARADWTTRREAELLPVPYFHVVFTLPGKLEPLALDNKRIVYGLLFRAAAETLQEVAANPKHLGAEIGVLAVLHTWGQNLMHHPHVHCVVPAGGLSPSKDRWISCPRSAKTGLLFFLPVRVLSRVFRGKFLHYLKQAFHQGDLSFHGSRKHLSDSLAFNDFLTQSVRHEWVVYAKRPFGGPEQVLKYLARYTHRVAISNQRLIDLQNGQVRFHWKDYAADGAKKIMTLGAVEFIRRFLQHTLPPGFQRIRYYGFLANRRRHQNLDLCRRFLAVENAFRPDNEAHSPSESVLSKAEEEGFSCPVCELGRMTVIERIDPIRPQVNAPHFLPTVHQHSLPIFNTS